jgi:nicotinamide-nucleotide amidase
VVKAHIIIIGDELLDGVIQDIHVKRQANWLTHLGVHLSSVSFCRDDKDELLKQLQDASQNCQIVLTTGGLGPTLDDKTKYILADFIGSELKDNLIAEDIAVHNYKRIGKEWTKEHSNYHLIPVGVVPLENPVGLAPGLYYEKANSIILCAPGVPRELYAMSETIFTPIITRKYEHELTCFNQFVVRTHSIPEEKIFITNGPSFWKSLETYGKVSSLPQSSGVDIRITLNETNLTKRNDNIKILHNLFEKSFLKENIWQYGDLPIEEYILNKCREKSLTLSLAESCTGGLASSLFTDISGCSDIFMGSAVTYSNESKTTLLGVKEDTIQRHGAVSTEVVEEMSKGSLEAFNSTIAISYSGIAGPNGGTKEKPVGTVAISVSSRNKTESKMYQFYGDRLSLKKRFVMRGLMDLLMHIESL